MGRDKMRSLLSILAVVALTTGSALPAEYVEEGQWARALPPPECNAGYELVYRQSYEYGCVMIGNIVPALRATTIIRSNMIEWGKDCKNPMGIKVSVDGKEVDLGTLNPNCKP